MVKLSRKGLMTPVRLWGGAVLLGVHLSAWPAANPFLSAVTVAVTTAAAEPTLVLAGREAGSRWEQLSAEERESVRARRKQYEALPPAERQKIRDIHQRYQQLSPEERRELQEKWRSQRGTNSGSRGARPRDRD